MCSKLFLTLMIIATVCIQFGHCHHCFTCYDRGYCHNYTMTYCDPMSAEATLRTAELFYNDVQYIDSNEYECFKGIYGSDNQPIGDLRGCVPKGAIICGNYKTQMGEDLCTLCSMELCNSVATISSSVFITLGLFVLSKLL